MVQPSITKTRLEITYLRFYWNSPGAIELRPHPSREHSIWIIRDRMTSVALAWIPAAPRRHAVASGPDISTIWLHLSVLTCMRCLEQPWLNNLTPYKRICSEHYSSVIVSAMASEITSVLIVCSTVFRCRSKKTSKLRVTGLCEENSPVTGGFPS